MTLHFPLSTLHFPLTIACCLLLAACNGNTTKSSENPATGTWSVQTVDSLSGITTYDSMRVIEFGEDGHPATIVYYVGDEEHWMQFYSTRQLRSTGISKNGVRQGQWIFYHPNGNLQVECTFVDGLEEGPYRIYRDNGFPYYIGQYSHGQRVGTWEAYDDNGELAQKIEY